MSLSDISIQQAIDLGHSTLQHIQDKKASYTYLYDTYSFFNTFWRTHMKFTGGDELEGHIVLGDEGNAKHTGRWAEDTHNIVNITKKYTLNTVHATTNMSYNLVEADLNRGPERIYDMIETKYDNMCREMVDEVYGKIWLTPANSSDSDNPHGISAWLPLGTDDSTGGWTGYTPKYGNGSSYNIGGLTSSATENARWASYYADHNGNLDDSLYVLLDRACRKLNFEGPAQPKALDLNTPGASSNFGAFSIYTNDTVLGTLNALNYKNDDQSGYRISEHYGIPMFKGIPMYYVPMLETADTTRYGTNPIFGINHQLLYPKVLNGWYFRISPPVNRAAGNQHLVMSVYCDLEYQVWGKQRRHMGYLISQQ
jgi:hypothetical protein